jgi:hypothetical protein
MIWLSRILNTRVPLSTFSNESRRWETCAVGEIHKNVPTVVYRSGLFGNTAPTDGRLGDLGSEFHTAVLKNQRARALRLYSAIQRRAARLSGVRVR